MDNGVRVRFVYITKQGRYAVHEKITADPEDWEGQGERLWRDPVTWTRSFWLRSDRTLDIFDTLDQWVVFMVVFPGERCVFFR